MDSRMRQSLDNYITGGRYREWDEELTCQECGNKWTAKMFTEYGANYFKDDDNSACPKCGSEVEE